MNAPHPSNCSNCPIFEGAILNGCAADSVDSVLSCRDRITFDIDVPIIREGEPITGVYCIAKGSVALTKLLPNGDEAVTTTARPGDLIGVPGVFTSKSYINGSRTLEPTEVCFIPKAEFLELARLHPAVVVRATMWVGQRIEKLERHRDDDPHDIT